MKIHVLPLLLMPLLLCGCTDIRTRRAPDILAADLGNSIRLAAHATQSDEIITAEAKALPLLPEALQNASGAEISVGHISLLLMHGNPCAMLETALEQQWLPPTAAVLCLPGSACDALINGTAPAAERLTAAAETGQLPLRTADTVLGDLLGGSGITAFPAEADGRLTLLLCDRERAYGTLSENACRGLALLGNRRKQFCFPCGESVCSIRKTRLQIRVTELADRLCITVSGKITAETDAPAAAEQILTEMLSAALRETACDAGADLLFLREYAVRGGIRAAKTCSRAEWAALLRRAESRVQIAVSALETG